MHLCTPAQKQRSVQSFVLDSVNAFLWGASGRKIFFIELLNHSNHDVSTERLFFFNPDTGSINSKRKTPQS